jgi:hypothetical protein
MSFEETIQKQIDEAVSAKIDALESKLNDKFTATEVALSSALKMVADNFLGALNSLVENLAGTSVEDSGESAVEAARNEFSDRFRTLNDRFTSHYEATLDQARQVLRNSLRDEINPLRAEIEAIKVASAQSAQAAAIQVLVSKGVVVPTRPARPGDQNVLVVRHASPAEIKAAQG